MGGVNQDISRVEGCVLKEEIVFVWLELVQKCQPKFKMFKIGIICRTR